MATTIRIRGTISVAIGDRVQFHGNDKKIGIYNGTLATVTEIEGHYLSVRFDDGRSATFNAKKFDKFGLGYAGTVYRGQGKTQTEVYALYDSAFAWNARTAYVGMTRHKAKVELFVPRELAQTGSELAARVHVDDNNMPALLFAKSPETARELRIARIRKHLFQATERVRAEATKIIPQEPHKRSKVAVWRDTLPKYNKLFDNRSKERRNHKKARQKYAQANWIIKFWCRLTKKLEATQARQETAERKVSQFVSNPARQKKVAKVMSDERKTYQQWLNQKAQHTWANKQFADLFELKKALEFAEKTNWPCINVHDLSSLEAQMQPYVKKLKTCAEHEQNEAEKHLQIALKIEEIPALRMRR